MDLAGIPRSARQTPSNTRHRRDGGWPRSLPEPRIVGPRRRPLRGHRCPRRPPRRRARGPGQPGQHGPPGVARGTLSSLRSSRTVDALRSSTTGIVTVTQLWYHDLLLREDVAQAAEREHAGSHLVEALRPEAEDLFQRNPQAADWLARVEFASRAVPDLNWPSFESSHSASYSKPSARENPASKRSSESTSFHSCSAGSRPHRAANCTREHHQTLSLPSTRHSASAYESGRPPILAVRLQELFGWSETPRVAAGPDSRLAAHPRAQQSPCADHERPQKLLDHNLPPGAKRPPQALPPNTPGQKTHFKLVPPVFQTGRSPRGEAPNLNRNRTPNLTNCKAISPTFLISLNRWQGCPGGLRGPRESGRMDPAAVPTNADGR